MVEVRIFLSLVNESLLGSCSLVMMHSRRLNYHEYPSLPRQVMFARALAYGQYFLHLACLQRQRIKHIIVDIIANSRINVSGCTGLIDYLIRQQRPQNSTSQQDPSYFRARLIFPLARILILLESEPSLAISDSTSHS
jgi:hypothetical protein